MVCYVQGVLTWNAPTTSNGILNRYTIYINGLLWWSSTSQPPPTSFYLVGLQASTDYAV
jgi:hypothetical protein